MHKFGDQALNVIGSYSPRKVRLYANRLRELMPDQAQATGPYSWLDIGAGYGEMLSAAQEILPSGSRIAGIEPCEPKVQKAKALGIAVTATPLSKVEGTHTHLSLINVFSHLPDPVEFLRQLAGLLEVGGTLLVVTGNGGDIARDEFPGSLYLPDHLLFAGEANVKTAFERAGFEIIANKAIRILRRWIVHLSLP